MYMVKNVYKRIMNTIAGVPPETGGILGEKNGVLCEYYYDMDSIRNSDMYRPSTEKLNHVIKNWVKTDIRFAGIIHSHDRAQPYLSCADIYYARKIMEVNEMNKILFPLVLIGKSKELVLYEVEIEGAINRYNVELV